MSDTTLTTTLTASTTLTQILPTTVTTMVASTTVIQPVTTTITALTTTTEILPTTVTTVVGPTTVIQPVTTTITALTTTTEIVPTTVTTVVGPTTVIQPVTTTFTALTTTTEILPTTVTTVVGPTTVIQPTTVTALVATTQIQPTTVTALVTTTQIQPTTVTAVLATTQAQPTTVTAPQATVTVVQPTTFTQVAVSTVMAPAATAAAATLVIDGAVQLAAPRTFELTGSLDPKSNVVQIEFYDGPADNRHDLGAATLDKDGTFTFIDPIEKGQVQRFITAVATDAAGQTSSANAPFALALGRGGARQEVYDPVTGAYLGRTIFYADGNPKTIETVALDGSPLVTSSFDRDGNQTSNVQAAGQTLTIAQPATIENNHQADTTFVFDQGHGDAVVDHFRVAGANHDTLSLPSSDFGSLVDVLRHARNTPNGVEIRDPATGDTVTLTGVGKAALLANKDDIKFHD